MIFPECGEAATEFVSVGGHRDRLSAGGSHRGGRPLEHLPEQEEEQGGGGERGERGQRHGQHGPGPAEHGPGEPGGNHQQGPQSSSQLQPEPEEKPRLSENCPESQPAGGRGGLVDEREQ